MIDNDYIQQKLCSVIDWCGNQMIFIHILFDIQLSARTQTVAKQVEEDKHQIQMDRLARSERAAVWKWQIDKILSFSFELKMEGMMIPTYSKPYEGLFKFHKLIPFSLRKSSIHSPVHHKCVFHVEISTKENYLKTMLFPSLIFQFIKTLMDIVLGFDKRKTTWYGVISYKYYPLVASVQSWGSLVPMFPWCSWCWEMSSKFNINNLIMIIMIITKIITMACRHIPTMTDPTMVGMCQ